MYIYRFIGKEEKIIYVGRTEDINGRLNNQHFSGRGHLPLECYREIIKVEYAEMGSSSEMKIYELYYINKHKPKYNVMENRGDTLSFSLPEPVWEKFTGKVEPSYIEEIGKLEKNVKRLSKQVEEYRKDWEGVKDEVRNISVTAKRNLQTIDYVLQRNNVDYDKEEIVQLLLRIEYLENRIIQGEKKSRLKYEKSLGEDVDTLLWK